MGDEEAQHSHRNEHQDGKSLHQKREKKAQNFQQDAHCQLPDVHYQLADWKAQTLQKYETNS